MTSLAQNPLFFLLKVFSPRPLAHGANLDVPLPMPRAVSAGGLTAPSPSHLQKTFLWIHFFKMGVCNARRVVF